MKSGPVVVCALRAKTGLQVLAACKLLPHNVHPFLRFGFAKVRAKFRMAAQSEPFNARRQNCGLSPLKMQIELSQSQS